MLAVDFNKMGNIESKVVQFPINRVKKVDNIGKSTKMWCLKDREEIMRVYNIFKNKVESATSIKKEAVARRNLTMTIYLNVLKSYRVLQRQEHLQRTWQPRNTLMQRIHLSQARHFYSIQVHGIVQS